MRGATITTSSVLPTSTFFLKNIVPACDHDRASFLQARRDLLIKQFWLHVVGDQEEEDVGYTGGVGEVGGLLEVIFFGAGRVIVVGIGDEDLGRVRERGGGEGCHGGLELGRRRVSNPIGV